MQVFHFQRSILSANETNMVKHSTQRRAKDWGLQGFILFIFSTCDGSDVHTWKRTMTQTSASEFSTCWDLICSQFDQGQLQHYKHE